MRKVFGTYRVYLPHDDLPGLAMSRSIGDFAAHTAGVSAVPQIQQYDLAALYAADAHDTEDGHDMCDKAGDTMDLGP